MISKLNLSIICILLICFSANAQSGRKSTQPNTPPNQTEVKQDDKKVEGSGENRPVNIYRRPKPDASVAADCFRNEGYTSVKTVLRVTFDASAEITEVELVQSSGCRAFDEESGEAAKRVKFEPAMQDGKPITVRKTVVYQGGLR